MIGRGRGSRMPCESCAVQFSMFKRKRACTECERYYCSGCLRRGGGAMCAPCRVLSTRPLSRQAITHLKVRDLQCFLQRQNVSTRGCVEKEELISLCITHVNSASYRRRGSRSGASTFSTFKGLTSNINIFINAAFDLRSNSAPAPPPPAGGCFNSTHAHAPARASSATNVAGNAFTCRFAMTPGPDRAPAPSLSTSSSTESARVDTADCLEVEDLDDAGWEFITRPADPLPNGNSDIHSDVLLTATAYTGRPETDSDTLLTTTAYPGNLEPDSDGATPARAASELALHRPDSATDPDTNSLQDEPLMDHAPVGNPRQITLEQLKQPSDLELLSVKQLKELLTRNRVEYRGCLERADLLERARTLWQEHAKYKDEIDNLPIEECCKICMAAPLECVLLECGHIAACTACSKQLAECPICRQYVVRAVRFFRS